MCLSVIMLIEELRETIASKVTERNEISERVNKIVDQIEDWELNLDEREADDRRCIYRGRRHR